MRFEDRFRQAAVPCAAVLLTLTLSAAESPARAEAAAAPEVRLRWALGALDSGGKPTAIQFATNSRPFADLREVGQAVVNADTGQLTTRQRSTLPLVILQHADG